MTWRPEQHEILREIACELGRLAAKDYLTEQKGEEPCVVEAVATRQSAKAYHKCDCSPNEESASQD